MPIFDDDKEKNKDQEDNNIQEKHDNEEVQRT